MTYESEHKHNIRISSGTFSIPGTTVDRNGVNFAVSVPGQDPVSLILYRKGTDEIIGEYPMERDPMADSIRAIRVRGIAPSSIEYNFRVGSRVVLDPGARLVAGRDRFGDLSIRTEHQVRGAVPSMNFDWKDDVRLRIPWEDVIAYCLHVRGFTKNRYSKVRHKGTFRGIIEKIPYLQELGVNQVILLPAYDFEDAPDQKMNASLPSYAVKPSGEEDRTGGIDPMRKVNYWGFSEAAYFAPKASYAAGRHPDIEFKSMVLALHRAGIELIMDMSFPDSIDIQYMIKCLEYWVREYHVDGFRLMIRSDLASMLARCPSLSGVKLMCDYFDTDRIYPHGVHPAYRNLADMNDGFKISARRLLKSDEGVLQDFVDRQKANGTDKAVVNYITSHDGFTLCDLVSYDKKHNEENGEQNRDGSGTDFSWNCGVEGPSRKRTVQRLRLRQMKNAMSELLLAQGTPMILAGDEFGNSQSGNNNPYCLDSEVTWLDWRAQKTNEDLFRYVKKLIAIRRQYRILHMGRPMTGNDQISCGYPDFSVHSSRAWYGAFEYQNRTIGIMYCGMHADEEEFIYIAYNFYWEKQEFALPYLPKGMKWKQLISTAEDGECGAKNGEKDPDLRSKAAAETAESPNAGYEADCRAEDAGHKKKRKKNLSDEIESRTMGGASSAGEPERKIEVEGRSVLVLIGDRN